MGPIICDNFFMDPTIDAAFPLDTAKHRSCLNYSPFRLFPVLASIRFARS